MARAVFLGSSTLYGHSGYEGGEGGVVELLRHQVDEACAEDPLRKLDEIYNFAMPMQTITESLMIYRAMSEIYDSRKGRTITIAQLGGYDHVTTEDKAEPVTSLVQFRSQANELMELVLSGDNERTNPLIIVGPPPLDEATKFQPTKNGEYYSNGDRSVYNDATGDLAQAHKVPFINLYGLLDGLGVRDAGFVCSDNVHLNGAGHRFMLNPLLAALRQELGKPNMKDPKIRLLI
jgi:hypothetical protein